MFTIDELNQTDAFGKKQGYWEVFVDSNFRVVDQSVHDFCYITYYYNDILMGIVPRVIRGDTPKYDLQIEKINGKKVISGKFITIHKRNKLNTESQFVNGVLVFKSYFKSKVLYQYFENYYYDRQLSTNAASFYVDANYYGSELVKGYVELVNKRKCKRSFHKTRLKSIEPQGFSNGIFHGSCKAKRIAEPVWSNDSLPRLWWGYRYFHPTLIIKNENFEFTGSDQQITGTIQWKDSIVDFQAHRILNLEDSTTYTLLESNSDLTNEFFILDGRYTLQRKKNRYILHRTDNQVEVLIKLKFSFFIPEPTNTKAANSKQPY
jgi:hypothetical protein